MKKRCARWGCREQNAGRGGRLTFRRKLPSYAENRPDLEATPLMIQRLLPFFLLGALALGGCATVPAPRIPSDALPAAQSSFGRSIQAQAAPYQGRSGFRLLPNSSEAFMARAELIRNAQTSLDLQYYIVHDGISTRMLVDELLKAADRGVRVRILLDDTTSDGLDQIIATLAAHQYRNRLFTPLTWGQHRRDARHGPLVQPVAQHRRSPTAMAADTAWPSSAGATWREYSCRPNLTHDIDMLSVGPVAEQLGHSFDILEQPREPIELRFQSTVQRRPRRRACLPEASLADSRHITSLYTLRTPPNAH